MSRLTRVLIALALPLLVTTCASTGQPKTDPSAYCPKPDPHAACAGWRPILLHADDYARIDPRTLLEIDQHNQYGLQKSCWKAAH